MGKGLLFLAILLVAFGLRFHLLDAQSFWNDEGNSARLSERSIALIIEGTASDVHPPLYYLLLHGWQKIVGQTEFGLRAFSAFAGVLLVAVVGALGKLFGKRQTVTLASVAALLTAVNPALIYYSQEARMYAMLGLLAALTTWCLLNWHSTIGNRYSVNSNRWVRWAVAYVIFATAGLYTHYFFPAVLVAQNLIVLLWLLPFTIHNSPRLLLSWITMMLATVLLYAPWLPIFWQQFGADDLGVRGSFGQFLLTAVGWMAFGSTIALETIPWAIAGLVLLLVMAGWYGRHQVDGRSRTVVLLICLVVPVFFMFAAGAVRPEFLKFLLAATPFFCLLLATAVTMSPRWPRRVAAILLLVILPYGLVQSLDNLYHNPVYARADYRGMAARIAAENHPNAGVILDAANQWEVFTYYFSDESVVYPLPRGRSRPQPEAIDATLTEIADKHDRLYAIFWGEAQRDPERLIERWLDEHAFKATDEWVGDVRFVTYAVPQEAAGTLDTAVNLPFGEAITLEGFTLNQTTFKPGDILQVTLFWHTAVPLDQRYKVFLHLVGPDGQPIAQRDSEPGGGLNLTTIWPPDTQIVDNHGLLLPADLPSGSYTLLVGLYDLADPSKRLPIKTAESLIDALPLGQITIDSE